MNDHIQDTIYIPLAAALITGGLAGLLLVALSAWRGWPVVWAAIAASGAALLSWFAWAARMASILENRLAPNLPRTFGQADPKTISLHIHEGEESDYPEGAFMDRLPVGVEGLTQLASHIMSGASLSTSQITAHGLLDRASWEVLRDRFISSGLLAWRSGSRAHGCEVTGRGMVIFSRLAADRPTPYRQDKSR